MAKRDYLVVSPAATDGKFYAVRRSAVIKVYVQQMGDDATPTWQIACTMADGDGGIPLEVGFKTKQAAIDRATDMLDEF